MSVKNIVFCEAGAPADVEGRDPQLLSRPILPVNRKVGITKDDAPCNGCESTKSDCVTKKSTLLEATMDSFRCNSCDTNFPDRWALAGHLDAVHVNESGACFLCNKRRYGKTDLSRHLKEVSILIK